MRAGLIGFALGALAVLIGWAEFSSNAGTSNEDESLVLHVRPRWRFELWVCDTTGRAW